MNTRDRQKGRRQNARWISRFAVLSLCPGNGFRTKWPLTFGIVIHFDHIRDNFSTMKADVKSQHENAAARMVAGRGKYEHMTAMLRDVLHWLPVPQRIQFKIAFLTFSCVRGGASPRYQHVCIATANLSGRAGLRSAGRGNLDVYADDSHGNRQTQLPRRGSGHLEQSP